MTYRHRALIALVLASALLAGGIAVATAARGKTTTRTWSSSDRAERGGFLGVNLQNLSGDLARSYDYDGRGVVVASVVPDSPADKAGIREGDIITQFDGQAVTSADQLTRRVRASSPGRLVDVSVWRDGRERDLDRVELGNVAEANGNDEEWTPRARRDDGDMRERHDDARDRDDIRDRGDDDDDDAVPPAAPRPPRTPRTVRGTPVPPPPGGWNNANPGRGFNMMQMGRGRLGIELRDLDDDLGDYFDTPDGRGVLVLRVLDGTPADRAGLKAGDVILAIDGDEVGNSEDLRKEIRGKKAGAIELRIRRKGTERTIEATLGRAELGMLNGEGQDWMGWNDNDSNSRRVIRLHTPNGDKEWVGDGDDFQMDGMSEEDKAALKQDLDKLREDLREMRRDRR